ncbi:MAG: ribonuclease HII [Microcoleaceae cyanobacterium]
MSEILWVAGVDEVGRGALFGPVVAAAVILPETAIAPLKQLGVQDSKRLSPKKRVNLSQQIQAIAIDCKVGWAGVREIDRLNILQATLLAMRRSILKLNPPPQRCLIDGNQSIPNLSIPQQTIIKGDQTSEAIASASIIAKVWRDQLIVRLARKYPEYDLIHNKGYGTKKHCEALQRYGASSQHRLSFRPCQVLKL